MAPKKRNQSAKEGPNKAGTDTEPRFPYTTKPSSLRRLLQEIPNRPRPPKFDTNLLRSWGFKDGNDYTMLRVLKAVSLLNAKNEPTDLYSQYRLGLISVKFARDLHLVRKMRNDFAHNVQRCSFDDAKVKSRIVELNNSHGIIARSPKRFKKPLSVRDQFLEGISWMLWHLESSIDETEVLKPCAVEWGYDFSWDKERERMAEEKAAKRKEKEAKRIERG